MEECNSVYFVDNRLSLISNCLVVIGFAISEYCLQRTPTLLQDTLLMNCLRGIYPAPFNATK